MRTGDPASPSGHAADPSVWGGFSSVEVRPFTSWREGVDIGCIQSCPPERIFSVCHPQGGTLVLFLGSAVPL